MGASQHGLSQVEAAARLEQYGPNALPQAEAPGLVRVFLRQFLNRSHWRPAVMSTWKPVTKGGSVAWQPR